MSEPVFNIHKDVFGTLATMPKVPMQIFWGILMRVFPDGQGPINLPSRIWADTRKLVAAGIALEPEKGAFCVNPDVVYMSDEPTIAETLNETSS